MRRLLFLFAFLCAPVSAAPEPTSYVVVGERSQVAFDATFPLGDFSGTTDRVAGEFRLDPADVPHGVLGSASVNPASLKTGLEGRDRDLKQTLEVNAHPEISFQVEEVRSSFPSLTERADVALHISGVMRIRSVERPVAWTGRARIEEGWLWVRGEAQIRLSDFGITPPRKFFLAVGDLVRVSFDLRLAPRR